MHTHWHENTTLSRMGMTTVIVWRMCVSWVEGEAAPEPLDFVSNIFLFGENVSFTCAGGAQLTCVCVYIYIYI